MGRVGPARRPAARAVRRGGRVARGGVPVLLPPVDAAGRGGRRGRPARRAGDQRRRRRRPEPATAPSRTRAPPTGGPTGTPGSSRSSTPPRPPALPVLGVCRGMQVMAVHAGGAPRPAHARPGRPRRAQPRRRRVRRGRRSSTEPGSRLAGAGRRPRSTVNCHHHQSVARPPGLRGRRRTPRTAPWRRWRPTRRPVLRGRAVAPRDRRRRRPAGRAGAGRGGVPVVTMRVAAPRPGADQRPPVRRREGPGPGELARRARDVPRARGRLRRVRRAAMRRRLLRRGHDTGSRSATTTSRSPR